MPTLKHSMLWATIEQLLPQIVSFITSIILARLLTPQDFGLVAMISIFIAFANLFADSGMSQALIQRKNNSIDDETSVFILNIIFGTLITLLLFVSAPYIAKYFNEPKLIWIIRIQSFGFTISSFGILQQTLFLRKLELNKTALISIISVIGSGTVGIIMALYDYGVWSLVGAYISGTSFRVISIWIISNWRPRGKFSLISIKEIWRYSINILGAGLFTTFVNNLANVLIGKSYNAESLGYYNRAYNLFYLPISLVTGIFNRIAFPLFSKLQDNKKLLLDNLRNILKLGLLAVSFISFLLYITADTLIPWLIGPQWISSIKYLKILSLGGIVFPANVLLIAAIKATGRSDIFFKVEIIKKAFTLAGLLIAVNISIEAMAWSLFITGIIAFYFNARFARPLIEYKWSLIFKDFYPTILIVLISVFLTTSLFKIINIENALLILIIKTIIFTIIIILEIYIFRNKWFQHIQDQIIPIINKLKNHN